MAKPSDLPEWGTDATFTTGPETGSNVVVEPSSGYKGQGFVPDALFIGPYVNWVLNLIYQWVAYLQNLHNETTGFLDQNYTWTGAHTFNTAQATFAQEIQANGGVNANGATVTTAGGSLLTVGGGVTTGGGDIQTGGAGEIEIFNATTGNFNFTGTAPERRVRIPILSGKPVFSSSTDQYDNGAWGVNEAVATNRLTTFLSTHTYRLEYSMPYGAELTEVRALVNQTDDSGGSGMSVLVEKWESNPTTLATTIHALNSTGTSNGNATGDTLVAVDTSAESERTFDAEGSLLVIEITSSNSADALAPDFIKAIDITFNDPGPRNY